MCVLLLAAPFRLCLAVTVPDTAAGPGLPLSAVVLQPSDGGYALPRAVVTPGVAVSDLPRERRIHVSLDQDWQPGVRQTETDARLLLFVLLGLAAIAAWLAERLGRKEQHTRHADGQG